MINNSELKQVNFYVSLVFFNFSLLFLVYNNAFIFVLAALHHVHIFPLRRARFSVPSGCFCKTQALQLLLFVLKFLGTYNWQM